MKSAFAYLPFFALVALFAFGGKLHQNAQNPHYRYYKGFALQNPKLTPGVINHTIVADRSGKRDIINGVEHNMCARDFRTKPFRYATERRSIKLAVCAKYGIPRSRCNGRHYELDDIEPLEIGGKNVASNLWPQPIHQARIKDFRLEDVLGGWDGAVCQGYMSQKEAQACVRGNWVKCMAKVKRLEGR